MAKSTTPPLDQKAKLIAALNDSRSEVVEATEKLVNLTHHLCDGNYPGDEAAEEFEKSERERLTGDWEESLNTAAIIAGYPHEYFESVEDSLGTPPIVTVEELVHDWVAYFDHEQTPGDFNEAYDHYLDHISHRLLRERYWNPVALCTVSGLPEDGQDDESALDATIGDQTTAWSCSGLMLTLTHFHFQHDEHDLSRPRGRRSSSAVLHGCIHGPISPAALEDLQGEFVDALRSVIRSAAVALDGSRPGSADELPCISLPALRQSLPMARRCAELFHLTHGKKDSFNRRISNAVRLMLESDRQTSDAVGLALSVTALEALLGKKQQEISGALADGIAVLLEPDLTQRHVASAFVKDVYDLRSRVLHGDQVDGETDSRNAARKLAAGVLYGVWYRGDFMHRAGEKADTPDDLLRNLRERKWTGGLPDWVPDVPGVRTLWRSETE